MTAYLPPMLLELFKAGPPIAPTPKEDLPQESWERKYKSKYIGVANYLDEFEKEQPKTEGRMTESRQVRRERKRKQAEERNKPKLEAAAKEWNPKANEALTSDAYKTLFVGRLSYEVTDAKLAREFEQYGPIKSAVIVKDKDGKPRGYGFVEFEHEADMRAAFKHADGRRIEDRRIVVDVERGRTVDDWKPRRLGGGLGGTRIGGKDKNIRVTGRVGTSRVDDDRDRGGSRYDDRRDRDRRDDRGRSDRYDRDRDRDRRHPRDDYRGGGRRDDYRGSSGGRYGRDDRYGREDRYGGGGGRRDDYRGGGRRDDRYGNGGGGGGGRYDDRGRGPPGGGGANNPNLMPIGQRH
eukprot:TRINITY_DN21470_c0_g1_i1.p1 TRINITY_DN21470_c0_g1~~TRINITY_DN21470_c0_g1_i1.p1  ORF type:complete len:350 (+),score=34.42 TRINITY_DN21470_c0_g1_i1:72-1121(+)